METINLEGVGDVLDLGGYRGTVVLTGRYEMYKELIIKHANKGLKILATDCVLSNPGGFAIKVMESDYLSIQGDTWLDMHGGIKVDGSLIGGLELVNVNIYEGDVGLHMTQHSGKEKYGRVVLKNCKIRYCTNEGFYVGKSKQGNFPKTEAVILDNCNIMFNGCDGFQVAHAEKAQLRNCQVVLNGQRRLKWQDKDLQINYGVNRIDFESCVYGTEIQFLETKQVFFYEKRTG